MRLRAGDRLLFIGDSITDCGRTAPVAGTASDQNLGDGYVSLVHSALTAAYPDYGIRVLNLGVSGNTIRDLKTRWRADVLELHPTWLSIMIGINDVWRHFDPWLESEVSISPEEYAQTLDELVRRARPDLSGLILMAPYYLETNREEPIRARMDQFGALVRRTAAEHEAVFVDIQAAFDHVLAWLTPAQLAPDRVHVNQVGHMVIARSLLQQIEFDWLRPGRSDAGPA
jgi:lysophospholipase L1-like esterase